MNKIHVGAKYNYFTTLEEDTSKTVRSRWICRCICGVIKSVDASKLRTSATKSCGCIRSGILPGQVFSHLTVRTRDHEKSRYIYWICACICGNTTSVPTHRLKSGKTKSCGCLQKEIAASIIKKIPRRERQTPLCHPNREHEAKGLCKECYNKKKNKKVDKQKKKHQDKNWWNRVKDKPETKLKRRKYHLKSTFGISIEQHEEILNQQNRKCAICNIPYKKVVGGSKIRPNLVIDHCHTTDTIRGLLCNKCNMGLGYFQDDPNLLMMAATYLQKFSNERCQLTKSSEH